MKYSFITQHKNAYPITLQCQVLGVSRNGYYRYEKNRVISGTRKRVLVNESKGIAFAVFSDCTEFGGNLCRNIEVADGEENHVLERLQITKATGSVFNDFDNAVDTLTDRVG